MKENDCIALQKMKELEKWIIRYDELRKKLKDINNIIISGLGNETDKNEILYNIRKITKEVK